jgi:hypothetical protein
MEVSMLKKVSRIVSVTPTVNPGTTPTLRVDAVGEVPTSGWGDPGQLIGWLYAGGNPLDGVYHFDMVAEEPTGMVLQVISQISASVTLPLPADTTAVTVHSSTNEETVPVPSPADACCCCDAILGVVDADGSVWRRRGSFTVAKAPHPAGHYQITFDRAVDRAVVLATALPRNAGDPAVILSVAMNPNYPETIVIQTFQPEPYSAWDSAFSFTVLPVEGNG